MKLKGKKRYYLLAIVAFVLFLLANYDWFLPNRPVPYRRQTSTSSKVIGDIEPSKDYRT